MTKDDFWSAYQENDDETDAHWIQLLAIICNHNEGGIERESK